jgi:hypothetical protein
MTIGTAIFLLFSFWMVFWAGAIAARQNSFWKSGAAIRIAIGLAMTAFAMTQTLRC